jgi:phenylpyruvate tautomerase PptA (4-oxalocrotonate tautomerase family)
MPLITITMLKGRSPEFKIALFMEVHDALVKCFKIPDRDRNQRIIEIEPENYEFPSDRTEQCVTIELTVFPGRSLDAKRLLYKDIVERLEKLGVVPSDILIILNEPPLDNWSIRGGVPASETTIGFKIDV